MFKPSGTVFGVDTVFAVSQERMADRRQMSANLMSASG